MGFFDRFRSRKKDEELRTIIRTVYGNDISLFARSYANRIYDIPEVRTAIECFADIFSSIPKYVERVDRNGNITYMENQMSKVLTQRANPLQNSTQFWKNVVTRLMLDNNVFIEPVYDNVTGKLKHLYVLPKDSFTFELVGDDAFVKFGRTGKKYKLSGFGGLIYLNRFGAITGGSNNSLGLYETVVQSLAEQAINVAKPNKVRAFIHGKVAGQSPIQKPKDTKGTMKDLEINMANNVQGVSYLDGHWEVTPVNWQENDVNRDLMQFAINIIYNYFGITGEIINNKATTIEYQLFVRNRMEPLAQQIEQEFTNKIFTEGEIGHGRRIELDTFALSASDLREKTAFLSVAGRGGYINIDEGREMIGLPPLPDGLGQMYRVTADTMDIKLVNEMQAAQKGVNKNNNKNKEQNEDEDGAKDKEAV